MKINEFSSVIEWENSGGGGVNLKYTIPKYNYIYRINDCNPISYYNRYRKKVEKIEWNWKEGRWKVDDGEKKIYLFSSWIFRQQIKNNIYYL